MNKPNRAEASRPGLRRVFIGALLAGCVALATDAVRAADARPLTFGVVPQQAATVLARLWGPVFAYLTEKTGVQINFRTASDIPTFEERLDRGEYDLAYMNPYHFTVFDESPGYVAIGKARNRQIHGIVVVRTDSPLARIEDLQGATIAFPAPASFAATILPQGHLRRRNIAFEPRYVSSHDSVYRAVARGLYPAGGGILRTLSNMEPDIRAQLRVLWTTPGYTPHAFAAHPHLDPEVRDSIAAALHGMADDPRGRALLGALKLDGIEPAADADWDDVRALDIQIIQ